MIIFISIYLAAVNLLAIILTVRDKNAAQTNARRIKERTLLLVSACGGSAAMLFAMLVTRHKTRHKKFMVGIPAILIIQTAVIVFSLNSSLLVNHYEIDTGTINGTIKLMLVTDLHSCNYGNGQMELIGAIDKELPDAVLLVGDIYDNHLPPENATEFIHYIAGKYPCYYVSGNHEFWSRHADDFKTILESYGVKVLEGTSEILEVSGDRILICGIDDPDTDRFPSRSIAYVKQLNRLNDERYDDAVFTILLSHRPERIGEFLPLNFNLVLSGHSHGGQWRLPILLENGLLSPNQGLFPKYTSGEYIFDDATLYVSRGLARESTRLIPRIFNRPEIVVIKLIGSPAL